MGQAYERSGRNRVDHGEEKTEEEGGRERLRENTVLAWEIRGTPEILIIVARTALPTNTTARKYLQ